MVRALARLVAGQGCFLLAWPPGHDIGGIKQLAAGKRGSLRHKGRDVIAASMRELEEAGYLHADGGEL